MQHLVSVSLVIPGFAELCPLMHDLMQFWPHVEPLINVFNSIKCLSFTYSSCISHCFSPIILLIQVPSASSLSFHFLSFKNSPFCPVLFSARPFWSWYCAQVWCGKSVLLLYNFFPSYFPVLSCFHWSHPSRELQNQISVIDFTSTQHMYAAINFSHSSWPHFPCNYQRGFLRKSWVLQLSNKLSTESLGGACICPTELTLLLGHLLICDSGLACTYYW